MKKEQKISEKIKVSNADNSDRKFEITAEATIGGGQLVELQSGVIKTADGVNLGTFRINNRQYGGGGMNIDVTGGDYAEVSAAIVGFIGEVEALASEEN
ncbi:MAG: hypothetical protein K2K00_03715 [Muribaculaceae bacterium]|nr:hypothetical protein [Muribaculaceae bacterium]